MTEGGIGGLMKLASYSITSLSLSLSLNISLSLPLSLNISLSLYLSLFLNPASRDVVDLYSRELKSTLCFSERESWLVTGAWSSPDSTDHSALSQEQQQQELRA